MVGYVEAIKKPFSDVKTLVIGTVLGLIPIVSLIVSGFAFEVAKRTQNKNDSWPGFTENNVVEYLINAVKLLVLGLVYSIPALVLMIIGGFTMLSSVLTGDVSNLVSLVFGATGIFVVLGFFIELIVLFVFLPMAAQFLIKENSLKAGFKFKAILKKVFTGTYWISLIILIIYNLVLYFVLLLLSWVPVLNLLLVSLISYLGSVTSMSIMAEVFNETP